MVPVLCLLARETETDKVESDRLWKLIYYKFTLSSLICVQELNLATYKSPATKRDLDQNYFHLFLLHFTQCFLYNKINFQRIQ